MSCMHRRPLFAFILLSGVAFSAPQAHAATQVVGNCNDTGAGSLRDAVALAASGDTVDARALRCGTILLSSRIDVPQANLAILGPGTSRLTVDANFADRLFLHTGRGTLRLNGMVLARGREAVREAYGGCIRSLGSVTLESVHVHYCQAEGVRDPDDDGLGTGAFAGGGGIFADGNVRMVRSELHDAHASTFTGWGGGIVTGTLTMVNSRLHTNSAQDGGGAYVFALHATHSLIDHNQAARSAGVHVQGEAFVLRSTVADNDAFETCGGLCVNGHARVVDSTLSRNGAGIGSAGAFSGDVEIFNSTIAGNGEAFESNGCQSVLARIEAPFRMHIESSIVASNRCANGTPVPADIAITPAGNGWEADVLTGRNNLIGRSNGTLPADTIRSNPRLSTLANNGGPTPTMRLASDSPAIDRGTNPLGLSNDQRGAGFPRTKGAGTDIGAYER